VAKLGAVEPAIVARSDACRLLGISSRRFSRLESSGVFKPARPGRGQTAAQYDAAAVVQAFIAHTAAKAGHGEPARERRDRAVAELTELRIAKERRQLLPREEYVREGLAFVGAVAAKLRGLAARLVRAGAIGTSAEPVVRELVNEVLQEMSGWRTELELLAAVETERD
jgi:hypothetical protein